jgi:perosamine synthetase
LPLNDRWSLHGRVKAVAIQRKVSVVTAVGALKQFRIPFFRPSIGDEEIASVVETLQSGWLTTGPKVKRFEELFAAASGAKYAVAVSSCTAALHLALEAVGVGPGDKVLVPTLTFASTAEVVIHLGATPVLVDCRPDTYTVDTDGLERMIVAHRPKAMVPVHYAGQPCDMDRILDMARRYQVHVIEDAAHAIPSAYRGRPIGSLGSLTCFSFYANKTMTTGEGGMVTTNDQALADRVRLMSLHGISKDAWKRFSAEGSWYYEILAPGYKSNMTDIAAALGLCQLAKATQFWERREAIARQYHAAFADIPEIITPAVSPDVRHAWHLYVIQIDTRQLTIDRNRFIQRLNEAGIGTSVHYLPLHMHPFYRERYGYRPEDLPVARQAYDRMMSLPIYPRLTDDEVAYVAETVRRIVVEHRST